MTRATPPTSLAGKIFVLLVTAILLVLGFMFSLVLVAVFAIVGVTAGAWFFWKTRHLRKAMREAGPIRNPPPEGTVIEGEAVVIEEFRVSEKTVLSDDSGKSG